MIIRKTTFRLWIYYYKTQALCFKTNKNTVTRAPNVNINKGWNCNIKTFKRGDRYIVFHFQCIILGCTWGSVLPCNFFLWEIIMMFIMLKVTKKNIKKLWILNMIFVCCVGMFRLLKIGRTNYYFSMGWHSVKAGKSSLRSRILWWFSVKFLFTFINSKLHIYCERILQLYLCSVW